MKRFFIAALLLLALLAAYVVYWYVPRERAVAPRLPVRSGLGDAAHLHPGDPGGVLGPAARGAAGGEPLQVLAGGGYDVCLWVPYPHQNLGVLAAAIGDLGDVVGAAARLTAGEGGEASRAQEPDEAPTFGPFEVPPANELVACSDLAGGRPRRVRVVARIYPVLAVVAKLAGRLAGNPWLAGGEAGPMRIAWSGRLWSVTSGPDLPPAALAGAPGGPGLPPGAGPVVPPGAGPPVPPGADPAMPPGAGPPVVPGAAGAVAPELPESLAVVHWTGARPEIPAGYYALTRSGSDLAVSLVRAGGAAAGDASAAQLAVAGPVPSLLVAVGPEWRGAEPFGGGGAGGGAPTRAPAGGVPVGGLRAGGAGAGAAAVAALPQPLPLPPAALALFESGGSRLSSLGDLPGLAVFNAGPPGSARWRLPSEGIFRVLAGRLPAAEAAGWKILALDPGSLRQAEALAPRLAALVPPAPAGAASGAAGGGDGAAAAAGNATLAIPASSAPAGSGALSLGVWLEPRSALRIVSRIRQFVEKFPLATRRQVQLWRDWETVLDPLANCDHATLAATATPAALRLLLQNCTAAVPH
ncbi:MAG TPA: hypothetical protein VE075_00375 [Thermoanaerobaculia bacterium]|nr:hypothetical protein [Thermoanaerobaculia bacterium]